MSLQRFKIEQIIWYKWIQITDRNDFTIARCCVRGRGYVKAISWRREKLKNISTRICRYGCRVHIHTHSEIGCVCKWCVQRNRIHYLYSFYKIEKLNAITNELAIDSCSFVKHALAHTHIAKGKSNYSTSIQFIVTNKMEETCRSVGPPPRHRHRRRSERGKTGYFSLILSMPPAPISKQYAACRQ